MNEEFNLIKLDTFAIISKSVNDDTLYLHKEDMYNTIFIPRILHKEYLISDVFKHCNSSGYIISITEKINSSYLALLLNSRVFRFEYLKETESSVSLNITLTALKNFKIPIIQKTLQHKLGYISKQFYQYKTTHDINIDRYFEVKVSFFYMLCESMVLQLYHPELFRNNNIELIGNLDILFPNEQFLKFEQMFKVLSSLNSAT